MNRYAMASFCVFISMAALQGASLAAPLITLPTAPATDIAITGIGYSATIASDGCMTSMKVGQTEFLLPGLDVSRGSYLYQDGLVKMDTVTQTSPTTIDAKSARATIHYEFSDTSVTATVTNLSTAPMLYYAVLPTTVAFASTTDGKTFPLPATQQIPEIHWLRDNAKLICTGIDGISGPWVAGTQVMQTTLAPNVSRTVTYVPATPTPAEIASMKVAAGPDFLVAHDFAVLSPLPYQVFQRQTKLLGYIRISGRLTSMKDRAEARVTGTSLTGKLPGAWTFIASDKAGTGFLGSLPTPAGGWYTVEVRDVRANGSFTTTKIEHVGVGEVFVGAGQSNSTNFGQIRTTQSSGMVSAFSGTAWTLANDPIPGVHDGSLGGSFWPSFGDDMYAKYHVPIGVSPTGYGGTSVAQWQPGGDLFNFMMLRIYTLGAHGFRAVLWHQGETDTEMDSDLYAHQLAKVIRSSQQLAGWEIPWFVAQVSYHSPTDTFTASTRNAQKKLWDLGIAMQGPDTDTLTGDNRDLNGNGIHMSPKGLAAHGKLWTKYVGIYLDKVLN